jgi:MscS family membrane protein
MVFGLENYIVNSYLRALIILVVTSLVLRFLFWVFQKIALRLTSKTKTDVDDKFIARASKHVTSLVLLIGLRIAIVELPFSEVTLGIIGNIIFSFIVISFAYMVYYFVDVILLVAVGKIIRGESDAARRSLMSLLHSILKMVLISLVILYILEIWGVEIGPVLAALGIAGLAVALALQPALANIFSGVSIILDKSVKVGDLIYLDSETRGRVKSVGLRSTKIITFDNELIIVPNSKVADSKIQNIGEPEPKTRVVIPFGVAYGTDIEKVKKLVLSEIKKAKYFVKEPEPIVRFLEMADSSLNFKAYFYVDSFEHKWSSIDEMNTNIYNALNKAGVKIPFPQLDVSLKK